MAIVLGIGILPKMVDMFVKQSLRVVSWLKHKDDPTIINATYPAKYNPYTWSPNPKNDSEIEKMRLDDNT